MRAALSICHFFFLLGPPIRCCRARPRGSRFRAWFVGWDGWDDMLKANGHGDRSDGTGSDRKLVAESKVPHGQIQQAGGDGRAI